MTNVREQFCLFVTLLFIFSAASSQAAGPFLEVGVGDTSVKSEADSGPLPHLEHFIVTSAGIDFRRSWRVGVGYSRQFGQSDFGAFGPADRSVSASTWYLVTQFAPQHRPASWGVELATGSTTYDLEPSPGLKGSSATVRVSVLGRVVVSNYIEVSLRAGYRWADIGTLTYNISSAVPLTEDIDLSGWLLTGSIVLTAGRGGD